MFITLLATMLAFASCEKEQLSDEQVEGKNLEVALDEALQAVLIEDILKTIDDYSWIGEGSLKSAVILEEDCPEIRVERIEEDKRWPRKVTIDYGENCVHRGKSKSGKIIIFKTDRWKNPGSVREVEFKDYFVEGVKIKGHKRIENITEAGGSPTFEIRMEIEMISEKDGKRKVVKRAAEKTQTWIAGFGNREVPNVYNISGVVEIEVEVGDKEKEIRKELSGIEHHQGCEFPQGGATLFEVETFDDQGLTFTLNYSYGEDEGCDSNAMLIVGTEEIPIDLADRWRKQVKDKKESE